MPKKSNTVLVGAPVRKVTEKVTKGVTAVNNFANKIPVFGKVKTTITTTILKVGKKMDKIPGMKQAKKLTKKATDNIPVVKDVKHGVNNAAKKPPKKAAPKKRT